MRRRQIPPRVFCRCCGTEGRSWSTYWACDRCRCKEADLAEVGWVRRMQLAAGNRQAYGEEVVPDPEV